MKQRKINNLKFRILYLVFLLASSVYLLASARSAYADFDLGVFPPIIQVNATAPADAKANLTVKNLSGQTVNLDISFKEFTQDENENGQVQYLQPKEFIGADPLIFEKIKVLEDLRPTNSLTLAPNQQKTLTLEINIPKDEPPSDYYFSILFVSKSIANTQKNNTGVSAAVATNVLLTVGPTGKAMATIQEFSTPAFITQGPVKFNLNLYNLSSFFIAPTGHIIIKSFNGQLVGKIDLLPVNILSHTARFLPDTSGQSLTKATWNQKVLLGLYSADLSMALTPDGPILHQTIYFFALPLIYIIAISISIVILVLIILRVREKIHLNH